MAAECQEKRRFDRIMLHKLAALSVGGDFYLGPCLDKEGGSGLSLDSWERRGEGRVES